MAKRFQRSARQAIVNVTVAMCLIAMGGHVALAQDDSFVRQRDFEATKNGSTGFSVSFADDRRSFRPGETIALVFTFHRNDISGFNYEHCGGLGNADAVLDHSDGTINPQADFENNGIIGPICGVLGGVRGGVVRSDGTAEPQPPMQFAVFLNQAVRFDRPGIPRLRAIATQIPRTSGRRIATAADFQHSRVRHSRTRSSLGSKDARRSDWRNRYSSMRSRGPNGRRPFAELPGNGGGRQ